MELRPYQIESVNAVYQYFGEKHGNPLIVLPTGTGKSVVIADFVKGAVEAYPRCRILMMTHVKELIEQNYEKLISMWPFAPAGIVSAGLKRRDYYSQIVFGGVQSMHRHARKIGHVDLIVVDEAHMIPRNSDTMYGKFIAEMKAINPLVKVVGFTATAYRLDSGMLHEGDDAIFTDIAYEANVADMIEQGYLAEVTSKATTTGLDVTGVKKQGGEFKAGELERAVDTDDLNDRITDEIIAKGQDRGSWLIFCAGVDHAEHVAAMLTNKGVECGVVTGDTPPLERATILHRFKTGSLRAVANVNVLTTGFDAPGTDLIALVRPTESAGLYVQMVGRGTRIAEGKDNCLVLDFAGNVRRHGPIDQIKVKAPGQGDGEAPVKECPKCFELLYTAIRVCPQCGHEFPEPEPELSATAANDAVLSKHIEDTVMDVVDVHYIRHEKPGAPPSLRVDYICKIGRVSEWVCLEHQGYPRDKAIKWWIGRTLGAGMAAAAVPSTVDGALQFVDALPKPQAVRTRPDGKYIRVVGYDF